MDFDVNVVASSSQDQKLFHINENNMDCPKVEYTDPSLFDENGAAFSKLASYKNASDQNNPEVDLISFLECCRQSDSSVDIFKDFCVSDEDILNDTSFLEYLICTNLPIGDRGGGAGGAAAYNHFLDFDSSQSLKWVDSHEASSDKMYYNDDGVCQSKTQDQHLDSITSSAQDDAAAGAIMQSELASCKSSSPSSIMSNCAKPQLQIDISQSSISTPIDLSTSTTSEWSLFSSHEGTDSDALDMNTDMSTAMLLQNQASAYQQQHSILGFDENTKFPSTNLNSVNNKSYVFYRCLQMLGFHSVPASGIPVSYIMLDQQQQHQHKPTIAELLDQTDMINNTRKVKLKNLGNHAWIPRRLWDQYVRAKYIEIGFDPSLYIAILGKHSRAVEMSSSAVDTSDCAEPLDDKAFYGNDSGTSSSLDYLPYDSGEQPADHKASKKEKPQLSSWDPTRVHYPLGYIDPDLWFHMNDLEPSRHYKFDLFKFMTPPPPYEGPVIVGRQATSEQELLENQYDPFYLRVNEKTNLRQNYCGCCQLWHNRDKCNYLHHMKSAHGIRSKTRQRYSLPHIMSERPDKKPGSHYYIAYCDICRSWQNANNSPAAGKYSSWFLHQASHDIERNKMYGISGKKSSREDVAKAQKACKQLELSERIRLLQDIEKIMDIERAVDSNRIFKGSFFQSEKNFIVPID